MVTIRPEGPAFPSTHASASDPEQILWSAAMGTCDVMETD
jgi:hypothetical protein